MLTTMNVVVHTFMHTYKCVAHPSVLHSSCAPAVTGSSPLTLQHLHVPNPAPLPPQLAATQGLCFVKNVEVWLLGFTLCWEKISL